MIAIALTCAIGGRARAQVTLSAGVESFRWTENAVPREVQEQGPLGVVGVGWTQAEPRAWRFAYRSRYYLGWVDYRGSYLFADRAPVSGTSRYAGTQQEGQLRRHLAPAFDAYGALGLELWERALGGGAREDFDVRYAKLGVGTAEGPTGWAIDAGFKLILGVKEDAHLTRLGFDQNPHLEPQGIPSAFARVGYRFRPSWVLHAYVDGYRFKQSAQVPVSRDGAPDGTVFQPESDLRVLGVKLAREF